jgi:Na+-driven multidrug efflux pump
MRRFLGFFCAALMLAMPTVAVAQNNSNLATTDKVMVDRIDANGVGTPGAISVYNLFNGIGIGYGTGGGGVVTQLTSRTTGVTLNTLSGQITLFLRPGRLRRHHSR